MSMSESVTTPIPSAVFEGFFLQMVLPKMEVEAEHVIHQNLGAAWEIKPIGDRCTEFEVLPATPAISDAPVLSIPEIWEATYRVRTAPGVVDAEPLFGVPVSQFPVHRLGDVSPIAPAAFSLNENLPENDDPHWGLNELHVFEAWAEFSPDKMPGQGVVVGHPDTGYRKHPGIVDNLLIELGHDFVDDDDDAQDDLVEGWLQNPSHGTGTASVIISPSEAQGNYPSGKVVTGVAPGAKLIPFRVSSGVVLLSPHNLSEAIERATDQGAHVISISMGTGFFNKRLLTAVLYAQKRGVIVLAAAGNYVGYVVWPAAYDEVIAVAASNAQRKTWWASSRGSQVDVTAPGESVWRAQVYRDNGGLTNDVLRGHGTSFAVAAVAGVGALWLSYHGRQQLIDRYGAEKIPFIFNQIVRQSCDEVPSWDPGDFGAGLVNARKVLAAQLPDNVNFPMPPTAFALQQHAPVDNGGLETFAHMFQTSLTAPTIAGGLVSPDSANTRLRSKLAQLLRTSEAELPSRLKQVGQELAFHFAINPDLYNNFAAALSSLDLPSALTPASGAVSPSATMEAIRIQLPESGASRALVMNTN